MLRREDQATDVIPRSLLRGGSLSQEFMRLPTMNKDQIKQAVSRAFSTLLNEDGLLFECDIEDDSNYVSRKLYEICINHKLAVHLENELRTIVNTDNKKYFVDIEFNREGANRKLLRNGLFARPDIIVHNRKSGGSKENLLIVECKKHGASQGEIDKDKRKILEFMNNNNYMYIYGLQVIYCKNSVKGTLYCSGGVDTYPIEIALN